MIGGGGSGKNINEKETTTKNEDLLNDESEVFDETNLDKIDDIKSDVDMENSKEETEVSIEEEAEEETEQSEDMENTEEETELDESIETNVDEEDTTEEIEKAPSTYDNEYVEEKDDIATNSEIYEEDVLDEETDEFYDVSTPSIGKKLDDDSYGALTHFHKICGVDSNTPCAHDGISNHTQTLSFDDEAIGTSGNFYLTADTSLNDTIVLTYNLVVCLNGYNLTNAKFDLNGNILYITNCKDTGSISGKADDYLFTDTSNGKGGVTVFTSIETPISINANQLANLENSDSAFYNVSLVPNTTSQNAASIGNFGGSSFIGKSTIKNFNKVKSYFNIIGEMNIYNTTIDSNTLVGTDENPFSVFDLSENATIIFSGNNIVSSNTFTKSFFVRLEIEDAEGNANASFVINDELTFDTNTSAALFRVCAGQSLGIVNGSLNVKGATIVNNGKTASIITVTKRGVVDINGSINVSKNSSNVNSSMESVIVTNGGSTTLYPITVNINGDINVEWTTFSQSVFWIQNGTTVNQKGNVKIVNSTSSSFVYRINYSSIFNATGNITIGDKQLDKITFKSILYSINGSSTNIQGDFSIFNTTIENYLIFVENATEDKPVKMTFSKSFNIDGCDFIQGNGGTGLNGNIRVASDYCTISFTGAFNMSNTTLSTNHDNCFVANYKYENNTVYGRRSLVEFTGVTTFDKVTSSSLFLFGGNANDGSVPEDFVSLRVTGKLVMNDTKWNNEINDRMNGFINTFNTADINPQVEARNSSMVALYWFKSAALYNEITNTMLLDNCTFYHSAIVSYGTLRLKGDIVIKNCNAKASIISTCFKSSTVDEKDGSIYFESNLTIENSNVLNMDYGPTQSDYAGSLITIGKNLSIADGKTISIRGNKIYRLSSLSQSIIRIINDESEFTLNKTGSLIIENNEIVVDTAGSDNTIIAAIYAQPKLYMMLGSGKFVIRNNNAIGSEANKALKDHMFGLYAKNVLGFIKQIDGTKFNTSTNVVENVAFDTLDRTGVIYLDWVTGADNKDKFADVFTADNFDASIPLEFNIDEAYGHLRISDGTPLHAHKTCGLDGNTKCNHTGLDNSHEVYIYNKIMPNQKLLTEGAIYLDGDYDYSTIEQDLVLTDNLFVCLNGYGLSNIRIYPGDYHVYITNCNTKESYISGLDSSSSLIQNGYFHILGGVSVINIQANSLWSSPNTDEATDRSIELYNAYITPRSESYDARNIVYCGAKDGYNIKIASVSITGHKKCFSVFRLNTNNGSVINMQDVKVSNVDIYGEHTFYFSGNDNTNKMFMKNCVIDNVIHKDSSKSIRFIYVSKGELTLNNILVKNCDISVNNSSKFISADGEGGKLIIENSEFDNCSSYADFIGFTNTACQMIFNGTNIFDGITVKNNSFIAVNANSTFINNGSFTLKNSDIKEQVVWLGDNGTFNSNEANSEFNVIENKVQGNVFTLRHAHNSLYIANKLNIRNNDFTSGNGVVISMATNAEKFGLSGDINIIGNKVKSRVFAVTARSLDIPDGTILRLNDNIIQNNGGNDSGVLVLSNGNNINLNNTGSLEVKNNKTDLQTAQIANYTEAILVDSESSYIYIGNGKIEVTGNVSINGEAPTDVHNDMLGIRTYNNAGVFVQNEGTTFNTGNKIENVWISTSYKGYVYESPTENNNLTNYFTLNKWHIEQNLSFTVIDKKALWVVGEDDNHMHKYCGCDAGVACSHEDIEATDKELLYFALKNGDAMPTKGYVYLYENYTMTAAVTLKNDLYICLNGFNFNNSVNVTGGNQLFNNNGFTVYITNCKQVNANIDMGSNSVGWMFRYGSLKIIAGKKGSTIDVNTNSLLRPDTSAKYISEIYNVRFKSKTNASLSQEVFSFYEGEPGLVLSSVSIANYNMGNKQAILLDGTSELKKVIFNNLTVDNCVSTTMDFSAIKTNNIDVLVKNFKSNNCNFGEHAIIAVRENTTVIFSGKTEITNTVSNINSGSCYNFYLSDSTSKIVFKDEVYIKGQKYTTSGASCFMSSVRNGIMEIEGDFYFIDNEYTTTASGAHFTAFVNVDNGKVIIKEGSNLYVKGNKFSAVNSTQEKNAFFTHKGSSGGFEIQGNLYFEDNDFGSVNSLFYISESSDGVIIDGNEFNVKTTSVKEAIFNVQTPVDIKTDFNVDEAKSKTIMNIQGDINFLNNISIKNCEVTQSIVNVNGEVYISQGHDITLTGNTIIRNENIDQAVINIIKSDAKFTALGKTEITSNKVVCDIVGTNNTYAAAVIIPSSGQINVGSSELIITNNTTEGERVDENEFTHMYGVISDNINGFIVPVGSLNANTSIHNIGFTSVDGFGIVVANYPQTPTAGLFIADTIKDSELLVKTYKGSLWVQSNVPPHQHKTCGLQENENCNLHKSLSDTHESVLYSRLKEGVVFPNRGNIYLYTDYNLSEKVTLTNDMYICLNGNVLTAAGFENNGYNVYITNCQEVRAKYTGANKTANNQHEFNAGGVQVISAKGYISMQVDDLLYTEAASSDSLIIYNAAFTPKVAGQDQYTGTMIDYKPSVDQGKKIIIASTSFTNYDKKGILLYSLAEVKDTYIIDSLFENCKTSGTGFLRKYMQEEGTYNIVNTTFKGINITSNNTQIIQLQGDKKSKLNLDGVLFKNVVVPYSNSNNSQLIQTEIMSDNSEWKDVVFDNITVSRLFYFQYKNTYSQYPSIKANNITIKNCQSNNGNVLYLNDTKVDIENDLIIEDTASNKALINLSQNSELNVGNINISKTSVTDEGFIVNVGTISVAKDIKITDIENISKSIINNNAGANMVVKGDAIFENINLADQGAKLLYLLESLSIDGNLTINNITGSAKNLINLGAGKKLTIAKDLLIDTVTTSEAFIVEGQNSVVTIGKNVTITKSTTQTLYWSSADGLFIVNGNIDFNNNTAKRFAMIPAGEDTFKVMGNVDIQNNTFSESMVSSSGNLFIKSNWSIKNNTFTFTVGSNIRVGVFDISGELNIADDKYVEILDNEFKRINYEQALIYVRGESGDIDLSKTGKLVISDNTINADVEVDNSNKYFSIIKFAYDTNMMLVGSNLIDLADNVVDGDYKDSERNIIYSILTKNVDGAIVQNENTIFNKDNKIGTVAFFDDDGLTEGIIYENWTSVAGYNPKKHLTVFNNLILGESYTYFGLSMDTENSLWLRKANHENHLVCGDTSHTHTDKVVVHKTEDEGTINYLPLINETDLNLGGNFFLMTDLVSDEVVVINPSAKLRLCLNGFNVKNYRFRFSADTDNEVMITNCKNTQSIIEYSGNDSLFDNMMLYGKKVDEYNVLVKSNVVANGVKVTALNTTFMQYDDKKATSAFTINKADDDFVSGFEACFIYGYENKDNVVYGDGSVKFVQSELAHNKNLNYVVNINKLYFEALDESVYNSLSSIDFNENIKESIIKVEEDLEFVSNANGELTIDDNSVIRKNAKQSLISIGENANQIVFRGEGDIEITDNLLLTEADTTKTNVASLISLNADQIIKVANAKITIKDNKASGSKEEKGGNHLYNIVSSNVNTIFVVDDGFKFNTDSFIENIALQNDTHTGVLFTGWVESILTDTTKLKNYTSMFKLDPFMDDEVSLKIETDKLVVYKATPFYVRYNSGSLVGSDGKTYTPAGSIDDVKFLTQFNEDTEEEDYYATLVKNNFTLDGAYKIDDYDWEDKNHNLYKVDDIEQEYDVKDLIETDSTGTRYVMFKATWSEIQYNLHIDPSGGEVDGSTAEYLESLKYYGLYPAPKASNSESKFLYYDLKKFTYNGAEVAYPGVPEGIIPPSKARYVENEIITKLYYQNDADIYFKAIFVGLYDKFNVEFIDNNKIVSTASFIYVNNPVVPNIKMSKSGWTFKGWAKEDNKQKVVYTAGSKFNESPDIVNTTLKLYAVWSENNNNDRRGGGSSGGGGGSSSPFIGPMGDLTKNPLYANLLNIQNNIPKTELVSNEALANYLLTNPVNANAQLSLVRDASGNVGTGKWLRVDNSHRWFFFVGNTAQDGGFISNGWFKVGWAGQDYWYHFDKTGEMQLGWFIDTDGKFYYLQADLTNMFYGSIVTGIQIIDNKIYIFDENGALVGQYNN